MSVQITFNSGGNVSGGPSAAPVADSTFANAAAAVAAISNGMLVLATPYDPATGTAFSKTRAVNVAAIHEIVSL